MNILVIEDDAAIRQTLLDLLEINGHTVAAAENGPQGIALAANGPDLILCDIGLPGMDGYQVITAIQALPQGREIPFIFLTARAERNDQRRGMALGADDYITKPFTEREILDAIAARINRQRPLRERVENLMAERSREVGAEWAHELLTPLNGILGGLEMIESEADTIQPDELRDLLGLIRAGAERQRELSKKLVLYFEVERLKIARPASCDAAVVTSSAAARVAGEENRGSDLHVSCAPGRVVLPAAHVEAVVAELVTNAFRFSKPGQPVTVTGGIEAGRYRIVIVDAGIGLTPDECAQTAVFKQFGRAVHNQQGLGLGLAIARGLAEVYRGRLDLAPGPTVGLSATLELPLI